MKITVLSVTALADGKTNYDAKCKACHGADAKGNPAMATGMKVEPAKLNLTDETKGRPDADLAKVVTDGQGGKMPSFKGKLTDAEIAEVVTYFKGL